MRSSNLCRIAVAAILLACLCLAVGAASAGAPPAAGPTAHLQENLTVRAVMAAERLRVDKEGAFQLHLYSTLPIPLSDMALKIDSRQFDATVAPAPSWKTFPQLPPGADGGAKGCFTVALRRKAGTAEDPCDVYLRVYASCQGTRCLAAALTLAEALDEHPVPRSTARNIDAQPDPMSWSNPHVITDFTAYRKIKGYFTGYKPVRPRGTSQTRVYPAADDENVYLLIATVGYPPFEGTEMRIYVAPEIHARPLVLTVDEITFQLRSSPPVPGAQCVRCPLGPIAVYGKCDAVMYQVVIPRKASGLEKNCFFANFARNNPDPQNAFLACWRGNDLSVQDPVVYGKLVIQAR